MKFTSTQKFIKTTPRKLREVVQVIKDLTPEGALEILPFVQREAATPLSKAIKSAIANIAESEKKPQTKIIFSEIQINEGPRLKRYHAGSKGRAKPYRRKMSHIRIVLETKNEEIIKPKSSRQGKKVKTINKKLKKSKTKDKKGGISK